MSQGEGRILVELLEEGQVLARSSAVIEDGVESAVVWPYGGNQLALPSGEKSLISLGGQGSDLPLHVQVKPQHDCPSLLPPQQLAQGQLLEDQVGLAAFVDDADVGGIDPGHAGIAVAAAFVQ